MDNGYDQNDHIVASPNMENMFWYSTVQYSLVGHALVIGFAAQAAGFVYFFMTVFGGDVGDRKHRHASIYGMIVMTSAFLLLYAQWKAWEDTFEYDNTIGLFKPVEGKVFSNGYRYLNWSIDVPLLLLQLVLVSGIEIGQGVWNVNTQVALSGLLMIYFGYIGQFFEDPNHCGMLIGFGVVGCFFYLIMLFLVMRCLGTAKKNLPDNCKVKVSMLSIIFLVFWSIYPISYFMPVISWSASAVVVRQFIYTIADIVSKVIYGVILTQISISVADSRKKNDLHERLTDGLAINNV